MYPLSPCIVALPNKRLQFEDTAWHRGGKRLCRALRTGMRHFGEGTMPAAFKLIHSESTPSGVIVVNYKRAEALAIPDRMRDEFI
jgi:hypothetical protein